MNEKIIRQNRRGTGGDRLLPTNIIKEIAECLLPDIIAFYETEEGKKEFQEWKEQKERDKTDNESCP